jgi:hypothetical protein
LLFCGCRGEERSTKQQPRSVTPSPFQVRVSNGTHLLSGEAPVAPASVRAPRFRDVHQAARLEHTYVNGERGQCLMVETIGGGAGWLDYDADGHWDLYLNQGGDPTKPPGPDQPNDRLFRNLGDGTFEDVTDRTGIVELGYSQGLAIGDYDNDGFDDVYVTNVSGNTLFHNQGDGTFRNVTTAAGVRDGRWSVSAAWADLNLDGHLDLYVTNYCVYDPQQPRDCRNPQGEPRVCHPRNVEPWPDECYINRGDGTFSPEARQRGLQGPGNRALGVAVADGNNDGYPDVFVTNDTTANFLFVNRGDGTFDEMATLLGCAVDRNGNSQANMGVAVGDFDNNGWLDLYVTHFYKESNTLYRNYGASGFQDETGLLGLHAPTLEFLAFGTVMTDFNQDGHPELLVANGHIDNFPNNPLQAMTPQLFIYDGRRWIDRSGEAGEYFHDKHIGRAVAACDYDEDGDWDVVVAHENSPAALLQNESERGHWLKFLFRGRDSNRRGIGCRVTVQSGSTSYLQELCGGTSFAATHQPALIFGLGAESTPCRVTVRWPQGRMQTLTDVPVDRALVLDEPCTDR